MVGFEVSVELKNDIEVQGTLEEVDDVMNLTLSHATHVRPDGVWHKMEMAFVGGRTIRYVHIPDDVDILQLMKALGERTQRAADMYKRHAITRVNSKGLFREAKLT
eukprot:g6908.t1